MLCFKFIRCYFKLVTMANIRLQENKIVSETWVFGYVSNFKLSLCSKRKNCTLLLNLYFNLQAKLAQHNIVYKMALIYNSKWSTSYTYNYTLLLCLCIKVYFLKRRKKSVLLMIIMTCLNKQVMRDPFQLIRLNQNSTIKFSKSYLQRSTFCCNHTAPLSA